MKVTEAGVDEAGEPAGAAPKAGTEADREWLFLAVAALLAAVAGLAVATVRSPWYLTVAIVVAVGIFLVAGFVAAIRPLRRRRQTGH